MTLCFDGGLIIASGLECTAKISSESSWSCIQNRWCAVHIVSTNSIPFTANDFLSEVLQTMWRRRPLSAVVFSSVAYVQTFKPHHVFEWSASIVWYMLLYCARTAVLHNDAVIERKYSAFICLWSRTHTCRDAAAGRIVWRQKMANGPTKRRRRRWWEGLSQRSMLQPQHDIQRLLRWWGRAVEPWQTSSFGVFRPANKKNVQKKSRIPGCTEIEEDTDTKIRVSSRCPNSPRCRDRGALPCDVNMGRVVWFLFDWWLFVGVCLGMTSEHM